MTTLRFSTALQVFEAFPTLRDDVQSAPTAESPAVFLRALGAGATPEDGVAFCAHALGRREAVWWASQCVRRLPPAPFAADPAIEAADAWVHEPREDRRLAALRLGMGADRRAPTTWLALAAGWSGGNIAPAGMGVSHPEPHYTARAARVAILSGLARVTAHDRRFQLAYCLEAGLHLMRSEA
jgi:hypothetical protein